MASKPLKLTALVFAAFNLLGIPILAWALRPLFQSLHATPPHAQGVALSLSFMVFVVAVNVVLSVRAYRIDSRSVLTWSVIVWTLISAACGVALSALDPWSILESLATIAGT